VQDPYEQPLTAPPGDPKQDALRVFCFHLKLGFNTIQTGHVRVNFAFELLARGNIMNGIRFDKVSHQMTGDHRRYGRMLLELMLYILLHHFMTL